MFNKVISSSFLVFVLTPIFLFLQVTEAQGEDGADILDHSEYSQYYFYEEEVDIKRESEEERKRRQHKVWERDQWDSFERYRRERQQERNQHQQRAWEQDQRRSFERMNRQTEKEETRTSCQYITEPSQIQDTQCGRRRLCIATKVSCTFEVGIEPNTTQAVREFQVVCPSLPNGQCPPANDCVLDRSVVKAEPPSSSSPSAPQSSSKGGGGAGFR